MAGRSNLEAVRAFCESWRTLDAKIIAQCVTEDCFYHNVPLEPIVGRAAIAAFVEDFLRNASSANFDILSIAEAADGTVLTERVDRFDFGGKTIALPVMGSFQLRDGLIARWLDYFDAAQFGAQMQG